MKGNADEHIQSGGEKEKWHREIHLSVDLLRVTTLDAYLSVWGPHRGVATPSTQPCRAGTPAGVVAAQGIQLRVRPHLHHLALAGVAGSVGGGGVCTANRGHLNGAVVVAAPQMRARGGRKLHLLTSEVTCHQNSLPLYKISGRKERGK